VRADHHPHQFGGEIGEPLAPGLAVPELDDDVLFLHIPVLSEPLLERLDGLLSSTRSAGDENSNAGTLATDCAFAASDAPNRAIIPSPITLFTVPS